VKKLLLSVGLLVLGCGLAVVVTACGSEHAVSLGKPATTAATTTEHTGSVPSQLSLEVWFARDGSLTAVRRMHAPTQMTPIGLASPPCTARGSRPGCWSTRRRRIWNISNRGERGTR